jgi:putative transposase
MTGNHKHARNADVSMLTAVPDVREVGNNCGLPTLPEALVGRLDAQAAMFAARMRHGLLAASVAIGLEVLDELYETEVVELAGAKGRHDAGRSYKRHGTVDGTVTLGGGR